MKRNLKSVSKKWKYHIEKSSLGDALHYFAYCGRYVTADRIHSIEYIDDDDNIETIFCHKCLDKWHVRNPFG